MLKNLKIRTKLIGAFASILILSTLVGYFGFQGVWKLDSRIAKADDVNRLVKEIYKARLEEKNYILRGDPIYAKKVDSIVQDLKNQINETRPRLQQQQNIELLEQVSQLVAKYETAFNTYVQLEGRKNTGLEEMRKAGRNALHQAETIRSGQKSQLEKIQSERDLFLEDRLTKADDANRIIKWMRESNLILDRLFNKKSKKTFANWEQKNKEIKNLILRDKLKFKQETHKRLADETLENFETYEKRLGRFFKTAVAGDKNSGMDHLEIAEKKVEELRKSLKEQLEVAQVDSSAKVNDKLTKADDANRIIKWFLDVRKNEKEFIISNNNKYLDTADENIAKILKLATNMQARLKLGINLAQIDDVIESVQAYKNELLEVVGQINAQQNAMNSMLESARKSQELNEKARAIQKTRMQKDIEEANLSIISISLVTIILGLTLAIILSGGISRNIAQAVKVSDSLASGDTTRDIKIESTDETGLLLKSMRKMMSSLNEVSKVCVAIASGDLTHMTEIRGEKDQLGKSVNTMVEKLRTADVETQKRDWLKTGQAELASRLREEKSLDQLMDDILSFIGKYLDVQLATAYLLQKDTSYKLSGTYALTAMEERPQTFRMGEGLIGQVGKSREEMLLTDLSDKNLDLIVVAGSGSIKVTNIFLLPLIFGNQCLGVLELGVIHDFSERHLEFLRNSAETLAAAINSGQNRVRMRELLEETQEKSRIAKVFEDASDPIIIEDLNGTIIDLNPAAEKVYGFSRSELLSKPIKNLVPPGKHAQADELLERCKRGESLSNIEGVRWDRNKNQMPVLVTFSLLKDEKENTVAIATTSRDITEEKKVEGEMRVMSKVFMDASDPIIVENLDGIIVDLNRAAEKVYGFSRKELLSKPIKTLVPPEKHSQADELLKRCKRGESISNIEGVRWDRNENQMPVLVTFSLLKDEKENTVAIATTSRDITEEKKVEGEMRVMSKVFMDASDPIIVENLEGIIVDLNPAAEKVYGFSREELLSKPIKTLVPPGKHSQADELLERCKRGESLTNIEGIRWDRNENQMPVLVTFSLLKDEKENTVAIATTSRDITEEKKVEAALAEERRNLELKVEERTQELSKAQHEAEGANQSKSDFLANMSHEIRTPMNAVIGMSHLALQTDLTPKQNNYLKKIESSSKSLLGIINDILDFSKIEAGKLDIENIEFDLSEVLENLSNLVTLKAQEKGLEVLFSIERDVPYLLMGDPLRVGQILTNLTNNAVKFTEHGEIIVSIKLMKKEAPDRVRLQFSVRDSGIGLTPEQIGKLFQAFSQADTSTTRKFGGTGLGLTISKYLVEMMDGKIWVESVPGKGSSFIFTAVFEVKSAEKRKQLVLSEDLQNMRVLIVDDNESARMVLENALNSFGLSVTMASSGSEAISKVESADTDNPYDLIIMDWQMPEMNGIRTAEIIKKHPKLKRVPKIIMLTAYGREEVVRQAEEIGLDAFLVKPMNPSVLFEAIMEVFGKKTTTSKQFDRKEQAGLDNLKAIQGAKVLLVEDNKINQEIASELLEQAGLLVTIANHGEEGVEKVKQSEFDCVLMDIQMPVMDGYKASRTIRKDKRFDSLPILAMTANAMKGDREKCLDAGMNDHISKPLNVDEMYTTIAKWITPSNQLSEEKFVSHARTEDELPLPNLPNIDVEAGLSRVGGNSKLYRKLLIKFYNGYQNAPDEIQQLLESGAKEDAERCAHTIKGVAGNIGATKI